MFVSVCAAVGAAGRTSGWRPRSSADLFLPAESLIIIINLMRVANYPQQIANERRKRPRKKYCDRLSAVGGEGG